MFPGVKGSFPVASRAAASKSSGGTSIGAAARVIGKRGARHLEPRPWVGRRRKVRGFNQLPLDPTGGQTYDAHQEPTARFGGGYRRRRERAGRRSSHEEGRPGR